jgi:hypothetical protein
MQSLEERTGSSVTCEVPTERKCVSGWKDVEGGIC